MAAKRTDLVITIPTPRDPPLLNQQGVTVPTKGSRMTLLGHLQVLQYFVDSFPEGSTGLIIEDDADWDIRIHEAVPRIQQAVRELTHTVSETEVKGAAEMPCGLSWHVLWLGYCGDSFPFTPMIHSRHRSRIMTWNKNLPILPDGTRTVHYSVGPICTFAYAITVPTAKKLLAYPMDTETFDISLSMACRTELRCITINP